LGIIPAIVPNPVRTGGEILTGTRAALGGEELVFEHGRDYKGRIMEKGEVLVDFPQRDRRDQDTLNFREPLVFTPKCLYNNHRIQKGYD
jgi:hypothetical protein